MGVGAGADAVVLDVEICVTCTMREFTRLCVCEMDCSSLRHRTRFVYGIKASIGIARVAVELQVARAYVVVGADGVLSAPRRTLGVGLAWHVEALAVDDLALFVEWRHVLADGGFTVTAAAGDTCKTRHARVLTNVCGRVGLSGSSILLRGAMGASISF